MAKLQGGRLVARTLRDLGVSDIFSLAGGHINPIYDACPDYGIRIIDTRHEQGAAMAADAYGRIKREPGICLVTAGPGFTNALTGVAGAHMSNSPFIIISGRSGIEENDRLSLQEIDQQAMAVPVTKWARTVYDIKRLPEYVCSAYVNAVSGRPGPAYLGMSYEVLYPVCDEKDLSPFNTGMPSAANEPPDETVSRAIELIASSKKPVALAGSGAWYADASEELARFIEAADIPLYTLNFGRGIVSDAHDNCFGAASPSAPNGYRKLTSEADLILVLGMRLSIYMGFGKTFATGAKIIQVDIDPGEIGRNRPSDVGVACDLRSFLRRINEYISDTGEPVRHEKWFKKARSLYKAEWSKSETLRKSRKKPLHPVAVADIVREVLGGEGVLVIDGGDTQAWTDGHYPVMDPGHYVKGGPLGCMGVGVPFALGAKAARPDREVVLITGDGAIGMNFMEFETALRHKLPFTAVVCNDGAWGMTKHQLEITFGKKRPKVGVDLGQTAYHEILKAMGGHGELIGEPSELPGALERAFSSGVPALVNVVTDPEAVSGATRVITEMMMSAGKR